MMPSIVEIQSFTEIALTEHTKESESTLYFPRVYVRSDQITAQLGAIKGKYHRAGWIKSNLACHLRVYSQGVKFVPKNNLKESKKSSDTPFAPSSLPQPHLYDVWLLYCIDLVTCLS